MKEKIYANPKARNEDMNQFSVPYKIYCQVTYPHLIIYLKKQIAAVGQKILFFSPYYSKFYKLGCKKQ